MAGKVGHYWGHYLIEISLRTGLFFGGKHMKKFLLVNNIDGRVVTKIIEAEDATQALLSDGYDYLTDNNGKSKQSTTAVYELVDGKNLLIDIAPNNVMEG